MTLNLLTSFLNAQCTLVTVECSTSFCIFDIMFAMFKHNKTVQLRLMLAVWLSGNTLASINIVTLRQTWLVPGWVTVKHNKTVQLGLIKVLYLLSSHSLLTIYILCSLKCIKQDNCQAKCRSSFLIGPCLTSASTVEVYTRSSYSVNGEW